MASLSLALFGAACSLTTDLSDLQSGVGGGTAGGTGTTTGSTHPTTTSGSASTGPSGPVCGDGIIQAGEECDDGNQTGNDSCATCLVKCVGKHEVKDPTTHHCYWYDKTSADSVDAATSFCAGWRPNGTLAAVTSQAELSFLTGAGGVMSGTWLGANDLAKMGEYQWVTGEPWSFTDWAPGSPGGSSSERCVRFGSQGLKWESTSCQGPNITLCESSPEGTTAK